ncbi:MAG: peptidylprolyl isomerase [Pseudomonadota bacterium]
MRQARLHHLTLAALLLCAFSAGASGQAKDAPAAPAKDGAPPAAAATAAAPAAAATPAKKTGGFVPPASSGTPIDSVVVVVNDDVITRNELNARIATVSSGLKRQNVALPAPSELQRQILERMIVERAQMQLAKEMGVRVSDIELDRTIVRIAESQKLSLQDLRNQIEKEGTPYVAFREEIRDQIMQQRLQEHEVDSKIQISDAEVDTYLAAEKAAASEKVEWNLAQILVRVPDNATPEQIAASKTRADDVMRQLRTGADFAKMAATYSDASDALKGGDVGWRAADRLPPMFADVLTKMSPGQLTPIIKSGTGFHILKMVGKRSAADGSEPKNVVVQTHARHIMIKTSPTMSAGDAKRKLLELKERLDNKAAKFEDLARLFSNDSSASKGGDMGWLVPDDIVPELLQTINALQVGEVSAPVESPFGIHLIEVLERKSDDQSAERARNGARVVIRERKLAEAIEDWQRQVRDRAYVEFRLEDK